MKKNLKTLSIIFSVVFNIVFIGLFLYHKTDTLFITGRLSSHSHTLYEELDIDRGRIHRLDRLRDKFHLFVTEQGQKIKAKQLELIALLAMEQPDRKAIDLKQEEIQALQHEMQNKVIDHLLEENRVFTPEQRKRFFALIRKRIKESSGPRPRWMPQKQ